MYVYFLERFTCSPDGLISVVNVTYDNYLGALSGSGSFSVSGRAAVCQNGIFSSVCDLNWDQDDANVLCNSLGISGSFGELIVI